MEKSRIIWYSSRSLLGLIVYGIAFCPIDAKEIFDVPSYYFSRNFDFATVKTVSFFFPDDKDIDVDAIIKTAAQGKADVIITGKTSIEGAALSPNLSVYVQITKNIKEKSWLVTIDSSVSGVATRALSLDGNPY